MKVALKPLLLVAAAAALSPADTERLLHGLARNHSIADPFRAAWTTFAAAAPFPHAVIDGLFPPAVLDAVAAEIPESQGCRDRARLGAKAKGTRCIELNGISQHKSTIANSKLWGPHTRALVAFLQSPFWVRRLERLTGFGDARRADRGPLHPDPTNEGAGVHATEPGGYLKVHADFNAFGGRARRVNTFIFLNRDWPESHGGHLQLWDRNMTRCVQNILPVFNRFVAFECDDWSFHGHPDPLAAPVGRERRSIAQYYYTRDAWRPPRECLKCGGDEVQGLCVCDEHSTLYQKSSCGGACGAATCD